jgi:two-component system sensor histidine kinase/response regulator
MVSQRAAADPYDVMLVDWRMPGMDGWHFTRTVRADGAHAATPIVIMVTAHGRGALVERQQSERNLLNGFLTKPVTSSMVFDAIADAFAGTRDDGRSRQMSASTCLAGLKLLVVDDNAMNQQVASELLAKAGASVEVASGGISGVHKVLQAARPFDAVLMDIQMPDMDGYAATGLIRQDRRMHALPIIAMTANVMAGDRDACLRAGMNDHIGKPIAIDALVALLQRYCGGKLPVSPLQPTHSVGPEPTAAGTIQIDVDAALARMGGNVQLYVSLAQLFPDDALGWLPQLRRELPRPAFGDAAALLHSFRGSAGVVGAVQLQRVCAQLESTLKLPGASIDPEASLAQLDDLIGLALSQLADVAARLHGKVAAQIVSGAPPVPLAQQLAELEHLLEASDMRAVAAFAALERHFPARSAGALAALASHMAHLDFQQALRCCRQLRTELS